MVACFRPSLSWTCVIELAFTNHDKTLAVKSLKIAFISKPEKAFSQLPETRVLKFCPELEHYPVPYLTSAAMALVWQMYKLLVNLPNFSSCFSKFVLALFF